MCFFTQNIGRSFDNLGCLREWIAGTKEEDDEATQILEPDWARFGEEWAQEIFERKCAGEHNAEFETLEQYLDAKVEFEASKRLREIEQQRTIQQKKC